MTRTSLEPIRHPNKDFFVCDIFDTLPFFKDDMASMEHPVFSLSTKTDTRTLYYEHNGNSVTIIPSTLGLATIHDKDILLYCASHLRAAIVNGHQTSQTVRFTAYDLLVSTNRTTNNLGYKRLRAALGRLRGTTIETDIRTGGNEVTKGFGLIESWEIVKEDETGRMLALEIKLSDWMYSAILSNELLTINRNYFRLRRPTDRRIYEIARKHCGDKKSFKIGLDKLHKKIGSTAPIRKLRSQLRDLCESDDLPDYGISMDDNDMVTFKNRSAQATSDTAKTSLPLLPTEAYEKARTAVPGIDLYATEAEFNQHRKIKGEPRYLVAAFIGFCKHKAKQIGL